MAFSVTTPIYYVNSDPHLGHAYTTVAADVLARHHRQLGEDVFFLTGTDEHGGNVARAAEAAGHAAQGVLRSGLGAVPPADGGDGVVARLLHPHHRPRARAAGAGLRPAPARQRPALRGHLRRLLLQLLRGVLSAESDLVQPGNRCPIHDRPTEWVEEKNWFFPLSKWAPKLLELYDEREFVRPRARYNEARAMIADGLEDVSFTRASVSWGIPVPWEPSQTIYVWVDALLNYRTALEYGLGRDVSATFWPTSLQLMAKDILRLHGIIWPAMLMAAGYEPTRSAVRARLLHLRRRQDEQDARQRDRPVRGDRHAGRRCAALLPAARGAVGPGRRRHLGRPAPPLRQRAGQRPRQPGLAGDRDDRALPRRPRAGGHQRARAGARRRWPSGWR